MLKHRLSTTLIATAIGLGAFTMNAGAASVSGTANAKILVPLKIVEDVQMNFGDISPSFDATTTVVLSNGGAVGSPDGAGLMGGTVAAGQFTVTGVSSKTYAITLPDNITVTLIDTGGNGGTAMAVTDFNSNPVATGALTSLGVATIFVGATLNVGANQTASTYAGNYAVTVNYN